MNVTDCKNYARNLYQNQQKWRKLCENNRKVPRKVNVSILHLYTSRSFVIDAKVRNMKRIPEESSKCRTQRRMSGFFYNVTSYRNIHLTCFMTKRDLFFYLLMVYKFRCLALRERSVTWSDYTGQQNLTFFVSHELQYMNLAVLFMWIQICIQTFSIRQCFKDTEECQCAK